MRFNVFVILVCSIYDKNNLWHVKSWRFILTVEVVSKTALPRRCLVVRLSRLIYADYMQDRQHTRPRSVAAGNRHSHATLGIMGNHRKVVLYHNNVDFTASRGQRVKATAVWTVKVSWSLARTLMRNPMNINKNDCHHPTLLAFVPNILRSHMAVWLSFWKTHRSK